MARILLIAASTGKNLELAMKFKQTLERDGHQGVIMNLCALDVPMYTPAAEEELDDLAVIEGIMDDIVSCKAMIVCAPEYNGSMPPVLNNMIAWLSVQSDNFRLLFNQRKVGLATVSGGGGYNVITSMRIQFSHLGSNIIGRPVIVNKTKPQRQSSIDEMIAQVIE